MLAGVFTLATAGADARGLRGQLAETRRDLSVATVLDGQAEDRLLELRSNAASLQRAADSVWVVPLRLVPGVSRQVESVQVLSSTSVAAIDEGLHLMDEVGRALDGPLPTGSDRIVFLDRLGGLLEESKQRVAALPLGPSGPLLGELAEARSTTAEALMDVEELLDTAGLITRSFGALLSEQRTLLVASNNAEMRSGSGMFLRIGMLESVDGTLDVPEMLPAEHIRLPRDAVRAESETYDQRWGFLLPTVEWRNLAASPRFDVTAELASRMWAALGNTRPTGVLSVDPFALRGLLRATGPIDVHGQRIDHENVVHHLLHDQYEVFGDVAGADLDVAQEQRREQLGDIADATLAALSDGDIDVVTLVEELRHAVQGRHLLAWSSDEEVQRGWRAAGMSGELVENSLMVSVLNRGANKLDPFVDVSADLGFVEHPDGGVAATIDVTVRSEVPDGEVRYVAGPAFGVEGITDYGQYKGILAVSLPGPARNARIEGGQLVVAGVDGPVVALAADFLLGQRASETFRVTFDLPAGVDVLRLEPTARPKPVRWTIGDGPAIRDRQRHRISVPNSGG